MELSGKKKALIAGGILVAAGVGVFLLINSKDDPEAKEPPPSAPLVQTEPVQIRSGAVTVAASGTVRPRAETAVAPQVSGQVVYVNPALKTGSVVRQGEVLFRIDPADYRNAVQQAQADVAQQDVAVLRAEEEVRLAREEFETFQELEANRQSVQVVDDDDYAARFVPPGGLLPSPNVPRTPQAGGAGEGGAASPLLFREPQLRAAQAQRQRAQATLQNAQLQLSRTTVTAPYTGVVRSETVDVGSTVSPQQPVATLYAADALEVVVPLSDEQASLLPTLFASGERTPVLVTSSFGATTFGWRGFVDRAEQALDPETRTIDAVVRVPRPLDGGRPVDVGRGPEELGDGSGLYAGATPPLLVGSFVEVEIDGVELDRYAVVPRRALQRGDRVYAVVQDTLLSIIPVTVVQRVGEEVLVLSDRLEEGQPVIVSGVEAAVDGMSVRLASEVERGGSGGSGSQTSAARHPAQGAGGVVRAVVWRGSGSTAPLRGLPAERGGGVRPAAPPPIGAGWSRPARRWVEHPPPAAPAPLSREEALRRTAPPRLSTPRPTAHRRGSASAQRAVRLSPLTRETAFYVRSEAMASKAGGVPEHHRPARVPHPARTEA